MLLGYKRILERTVPCGRHVHEVKQKLTVLGLRLRLGLDIDQKYETAIRRLIRKLTKESYEGYYSEDTNISGVE